MGQAKARGSKEQRIAEIESQESVATVLLHEGEKIIDGTMAFMDTAWLGMPLFAAAGASPVQPNQGLQSVADALTIEQLNDKVERLMAAQPERTLLEQHDLNQSPEYRKGYEDGRLRGFEVGQRYAKEQAVQPSQAAEFNNAINFAIEQGLGCSDFLRAWREGDASEWPEFDAKGVQS